MVGLAKHFFWSIQTIFSNIRNARKIEGNGRFWNWNWRKFNSPSQTYWRKAQSNNRHSLYSREVSSYALSFYRSQNVLCQSKFFEPAHLTAFSASSKTFVPSQKPILLNANHLFVWHKIFVTATICKWIFGLAQKIWTSPKHFGTCKRTRHKPVVKMRMMRNKCCESNIEVCTIVAQNEWKKHSYVFFLLLIQK